MIRLQDSLINMKKKKLSTTDLLDLNDLQLEDQLQEDIQISTDD
jgi:hypothetical protein